MQTSATQRLAAALCQAPLAHDRRVARRPRARLTANALLLGSAITTDQAMTSKPESIKGFDLLEERFPGRDAVSELVVVRAENGTVDDAAFRARVGALRSEVAGAEAVLSVGDPFAPGADGLVSRDRSAVLLPVVMDDDDAAKPETGIVDVIHAVERADADSGVVAAIAGNWTVNNDFLEVSERDLQKGEMQFGLPAALVILLLVFGTVVAALVPLAIALVCIVVALGIAAVVGQGLELSFFIVNMAIAMGLALGIDYTLFVASRYREERHVGLAKLDAISVAGATASKAVLFSGLSFVVALLGLLLVPDTVLRSLAFGAVLVGLVTVAAALTLLPALLSLLGDRIERGRIPLVARQHGGESPFWRKAVALVTRRPGLTVAVTALALLALAAPVLGLKTGSSGLTSLPDGTVAKSGFQALEANFPGGARTDPAQVVIDGNPSAADVKAAVDRFRESIAADPAFGATTVSAGPRNDVGLVEVAMTGETAGAEANAAIERLRDVHVARAFADVDVPVYVSGITAFNLDYANLIDRWLPIVLAFVLGLSFVLLLLVFRSVVLR
jgi:RND superfamily putative drug exporter